MKKPINLFYLLLLIIPYFFPVSFQQNVALWKLCTYWQYASVISIWLWAIFLNRKLKFSLALLMLLGFCSFMLFSAVYHHATSIIDLIKPLVYLFSICFLVQIILTQYPKSIDNFFKAFYIMFLVLTILNYVFLMLYPDGMFVSKQFGNIVYFLDIRNGLSKYLIPSVFIAAFYQIYHYKKIGLLFFVAVFIAIITEVKVTSGTCVVGLAVILICLLMLSNKRLRKIVSPINLMSLYLFLFFFIVVFQLQAVFGYIIQALLHKTLTFTGRTILWDESITLIRQFPWLGVGWNLKETFVRLNGFLLGAHNYILQTMLEGGALTIFFFFIMIIAAFIQLQKHKESIYANILAISIFSILVMMLTEYYAINLYIFYILLICSFYIDKIVSSQECLIRL